MRVIVYIVFALIGAVVASYWPLTAYLPPTETIIETSPFLADWLPDADEDDEGAQDPASSEESVSADGPNDVIWYGFDLTEIGMLLTEMDIETEIDFYDDGDSYLRSNRQDEYNFLVQPRLCYDETNCLGLDVFSTFDFKPTPAQLSTLNEQYSYMKFYADEDGELILQKYITADYGIARGNIRINIETFLDILDGFEEVLNE